MHHGFLKKRGLLCLIALVGLSGLGVTLLPARATAAEQVVMKYKIFRRSIAVADLTQFAKTGETNRPLRTYLRMSGQDPDKIRQTLNDEVNINAVTLDRVLNSFVGDIALGQLSQYIYTPSEQEDKKAIRSALVLSASADNRVSLIEVIQNYPTQEVYVDGDRIVDASKELQNLNGTLTRLLEGIRLFP
jgi:Alpha/beta hydrolase of unknown function (DUF1400)